jgi:Cu-Zn family superoxide dismutase
MVKNALYVSSLALVLSGCAPNSPSVEGQRARVADGARVELRDAKGRKVGTLTVSIHSGGGVRFNGRLENLPGGSHGIHIHERGKCDPPDFASAGGHLNVTGKQHGEFNPQGSHEGDIGNVNIDPSGSAEVSLLADKVTLEAGPNSLLKPGGTSLVIHARPDDLKTDPSGDSGDRIACGIITR